ncbi:MAG: hypothetical protein CM1200mP29_16550 [Verrucomicrobiota bacterium]|nr:MAG: hypothetical protein CM1200mP29_16550 [Verrucomicrobiota bacterium]
MLRESLKCDAERLAAGRLRFFGHLDVQADTPPNWQCDYIAGVDVSTDQSAFKLNHRELTDGAAIKSVWEPSRWYGPVRMAQACWLLGSRRSGERCLDWLEDWVANNPPYTGWHWTSALESGMRLVAFTWIDAFLMAFEGREPGDLAKRLATLRADILPSHVWFTWRHRTFGSSANNHLLGELCGLALATARWAPAWPSSAPICPGSAGCSSERHCGSFTVTAATSSRRSTTIFFMGILLGSPAGLVAVGAMPPVRRDRIDTRLGQAARFHRKCRYRPTRGIMGTRTMPTSCRGSRTSRGPPTSGGSGSPAMPAVAVSAPHARRI